MAFSAHFRPPRSIRLGMALLFVALLAGCASPITARVTSFNQWPADAAGSTFSFISPVDSTRELEQATYESHVQAALEKQGLRRAPPGQVGRIQAEVRVISRNEQKTWLQPVYHDQPFFLPPYRDAAGRVFPGAWVPDPFGPRYVGDRQVSRIVWLSNLRLRLLDTRGSPPGKPHTVFESRASYEGDSDDLPALVPYLVRAVFDDFPGQNGRTRSVNFDSKTGALIKK